eukprot:scaffold131745_cov66-Phaeocystis_antarctica.AAC.6
MYTRTTHTSGPFAGWWVNVHFSSPCSVSTRSSTVCSPAVGPALWMVNEWRPSLVFPSSSVADTAPPGVSTAVDDPATKRSSALPSTHTVTPFVPSTWITTGLPRVPTMRAISRGAPTLIRKGAIDSDLTTSICHVPCTPFETVLEGTSTCKEPRYWRLAATRRAPMMSMRAPIRAPVPMTRAVLARGDSSSSQP